MSSHRARKNSSTLRELIFAPKVINNARVLFFHHNLWLYEVPPEGQAVSEGLVAPTESRGYQRLLGRGTHPSLSVGLGDNRCGNRIFAKQPITPVFFGAEIRISGQNDQVKPQPSPQRYAGPIQLTASILMSTNFLTLPIMFVLPLYN